MKNIAKAKVTVTEEVYTEQGNWGPDHEKIRVRAEVEWKVPDGVSWNRCLAFFFQEGELEKNGDEWQLPETAENRHSRGRWRVKVNNRPNGYTSIWLSNSYRAKNTHSEWFDVLRSEAQALRKMWDERGRDAVTFSELME